MSQFHHKPIKKFSLDGQIYDDALMPRLKTEYIRILIAQMRLSGYVQRLDIDTDFTIEYDNKKEIFNFQISLYGIYVGKRKSEWIQGIDGQRAIYIQKNKLNESSQDQASKLNQK